MAEDDKSVPTFSLVCLYAHAQPPPYWCIILRKRTRGSPRSSCICSCRLGRRGGIERFIKYNWWRDRHSNETRLSQGGLEWKNVNWFSAIIDSDVPSLETYLFTSCPYIHRDKKESGEDIQICRDSSNVATISFRKNKTLFIPYFEPIWSAAYSLSTAQFTSFTSRNAW